jgi:hypothetical protein
MSNEHTTNGKILTPPQNELFSELVVQPLDKITEYLVNHSFTSYNYFMNFVDPKRRLRFLVCVEKLESNSFLVNSSR